MNTVDIVIISDAKTEELKQITKDAIDSLVNEKASPRCTYYIYVVESNSAVTYNEYNDFKWKKFIFKFIQ